MNWFLLFISLCFGQAFAQTSYTDVNMIEARRNLEKVIASDYSAQYTEAEKVEWVKARLALIALERLQGNEAKALKVFDDCREYCGKFAASGEWGSLKKWACSKNPNAKPCAKKN